MRKIREVLRLKFEMGLSARQIAVSLQVGRATIGDYLARGNATGLSWPLPSTLSDGELERRLFPPPPAVPSEQRPLPDWPAIHAELRRPGVTLALLWQEYKTGQPHGFQYSWFCDHYRAWQGKLDVVMRQEQRVGEKLFVDYAGQTVPVIDRHSGEIRQAQVFVAVLGASSYTFAEATWSQQLPDWLGSHARCFAFLGGVPEIVVPDYVASHIIRHASARHTTQGRKRTGMGIEEHLVALAWISHQPERTAGTQLQVRHLHVSINAANQQTFLAPVELECLAERKAQRHEGP